MSIVQSPVSWVLLVHPARRNMHLVPAYPLAQLNEYDATLHPLFRANGRLYQVCVCEPVRAVLTYMIFII